MWVFFFLTFSLFVWMSDKGYYVPHTHSCVGSWVDIWGTLILKGASRFRYVHQPQTIISLFEAWDVRMKVLSLSTGWQVALQWGRLCHPFARHSTNVEGLWPSMVQKWRAAHSLPPRSWLPRLHARIYDFYDFLGGTHTIFFFLKGTLHHWPLSQVEKTLFYFFAGK